MTRFVGTPLRGIEFSSVSDEAISARVVNDAHARIRIDAGGRITWSSGTASGDVNLYRDGANVLKTDDLLQATGGLVTLTTNGVPTEALPNGSIAVDTTNNVFYFRSGNQWLEVSSGANVTIQSSEPVGAESGDLWFDSDTEVLYILNGATWVSVSGSLTLSDLEDVNVAGVQAGEILAYDGTNWVPSLGNNPKYAVAEVIGDGFETEFTITHNFQSRDVFVIARNNASPYEHIEIAWEATDTNTVDILFSTPPGVNGARINVLYTGATTLNGTYTQTIGDGTSLSYVINHDFDTRDINVVCREAASPYGVVDVAWEATSTNSATLYFSEAPEVNEIRVIVYSSEILFSRVGARELDELDDVVITSPTTGQVLRFNGTHWVDDSLTLNDIANVDVTGATSGEFLKFDGTDWVPDSVPTINALDDIGDVDVTSATTGEYLQYDGTNWVASPMANTSYTQTIGDGTSTDFVLTHNLGTRDIMVVAREASSPYAVLDINWEATTTNTVTVYASPPPSGSSVRINVYSIETTFQSIEAYIIDGGNASSTYGSALLLDGGGA